jgi:hypothetical protein
MAKIMQFRRKTEAKLYTVQYLRSGRWRTLPLLPYGSKKLASEGLARLQRHRPDVQFRVGPYGYTPGPVRAKRKPVLPVAA